MDTVKKQSKVEFAFSVFANILLGILAIVLISMPGLGFLVLFCVIDDKFDHWDDSAKFGLEMLVFLSQTAVTALFWSFILK